MRIFGGRGNKRHAPVLNVLKQRLLLLFVKILYLVDVKKYSAAAENVVGRA